MSIKAICLVVAGSMALFAPNPAFKPYAVNVTVADEANQPIQGASITTARAPWLHTRLFLRPLLARIQIEDTRNEIYKKYLTNEEGIAKYRMRSYFSPGGIVEKEGYYTGYLALKLEDGYRSSTWLSHPIKGTVVLREIRNPVPLYVLKSRNLITKAGVGEVMQFDFFCGDWLPPYGRGEHNDLEILIEETFNDSFRNSRLLTFTFQDENNGFILLTDADMMPQSRHPYPLNAPLDNYINYPIIMDRRSMEINGEKMNNSGLFIRLRTETDENGIISHALYGRIDPIDFHMGSGERLFIKLNYLLNPTPNDNNLEWDGKTNLLKK